MAFRYSLCDAMMRPHNQQHNKGNDNMNDNDNDNVTTTIVTTRQEAGQPGIDTNLSINWEGLELEDLRAMAQQSLVVKLQYLWRKNGIPTGNVTINAVEYRPGTRATKTKPSIDNMIVSLSVEQKQALINRILAGM